MEPKIKHGGRGFFNDRYTSRVDEDGWGAFKDNRCCTWCNHFMDIESLAKFMGEINCPECMEDPRYLSWIRMRTIHRLEGKRPYDFNASANQVSWIQRHQNPDGRPWIEEWEWEAPDERKQKKWKQ